MPQDLSERFGAIVFADVQGCGGKELTFFFAEVDFSVCGSQSHQLQTMQQDVETYNALALPISTACGLVGSLSE